MRIGIDLDDVVAECAVPYLRAFAERFRLELPDEDLGWQTLARIEEVRRTGRDEILLTLSRSTSAADSVARAGRALLVRVPVGLSVERLADIFPVETDLARRQVRVGELDLRYRDQVIARLQ